MQTCSKCGVRKPSSEFPTRRDRASGCGTVCLACGRAYRKEHYRKNPAYYLNKAHRGRRKQLAHNYERLISHLRAHPCVDCGETDVRVLQFDHLDASQKTANVSELIRTGNWANALREIEKCEVRCGNCHRRKTLFDLQRRRGGDRSIRERAGRWHAPCAIIEGGPLAQGIEQPPSKRKDHRGFESHTARRERFDQQRLIESRGGVMRQAKIDADALLKAGRTDVTSY